MGVEITDTFRDLTNARHLRSSSPLTLFAPRNKPEPARSAPGLCPSSAGAREASSVENVCFRTCGPAWQGPCRVCSCLCGSANPTVRTKRFSSWGTARPSGGMVCRHGSQGLLKVKHQWRHQHSVQTFATRNASVRQGQPGKGALDESDHRRDGSREAKQGASRPWISS